MKMPLLLAMIALVWINPGFAAGSMPPGTPPKVVSRKPPEYPYSLRLSGNRGTVLMEFVVDKEGEVRDPVILKSSHPDFEAPAIEALLTWKFKPAIVDGKPVFTRMQQAINFELEGGMFPGTRERGVDPFTIAPKAPKGTPPEFQYDKPPRPVLIGAPVYPYDLLQEKLNGSATVNFLVDPEGHTRLITVREATRPEFGAAAVAMIGAWEFEPAQKDGKPSWSVLTRKQVFDRTGRDSPVTESTERLLRVLKKHRSQVLNLNQIDRAPKPRFQPGPVVPEAMIEEAAAAEAVIEFIIDRAGRAQLPRIVSTSREDFGWAAATAVARWQFTPPTKDGKPVDVWARQPVKYAPPAE